MRIVVAILLLALAGCADDGVGLPVRFVVPDGYRGVVSINLTPGGGTQVPVSNGEYVVTIPASGKMSVPSFDFLMSLHETSARYASGDLLPSGPSPGLSIDPEAIAFRLVIVTPDPKTAIYVVGTFKDEEDELKKHWDGFKKH